MSRLCCKIFEKIWVARRPLLIEKIRTFSFGIKNVSIKVKKDEKNFEFPVFLVSERGNLEN